MSQKNRLSILVIMFVLILVAIFTLGMTDSVTGNLINNSENTVQTYLSHMAKSEFESISDFFTVGGLGKDPEPEDPGMSVLEMENLGFAQRIVEIDVPAMLNRQRDFVISVFGDDAWVNSEFSLEPVMPMESDLEYFIIENDKIITEEEYFVRLKEYWDRVGEIEEVNPVDIFNYTPADIGLVTDKYFIKLREIMEKYSPGEPVAMRRFAPDYEMYKVNLRFNGREEAVTGEYDFRLYITNKHGKWELYDGLGWNPPDVEPEGDI